MSEVRIVNFYSHILKKPMAFSIYLPDTYDSGNAFPTLYFFHGRNGDEHFIEHLNIKGLTDRLIKENVITRMIIVCPRMDNTRGLNNSYCTGQVHNDETIIDVGRYEDYFIHEIIPHVEARYPVFSKKSARFVGGVSAGGYASILYGLKYPELFSRIGGHMPAVESQLELADLPYYGTVEEYNSNNPLHFKSFNDKHKEQLWYLDAGSCDEGGFDESVREISKVFQKHGINFESHIFEGHHNLEYIKQNIRNYLIFYGAVDK